MRTVANALVELSKEARAIFLQEPRLLKLKAPTYVLGELSNTVKLCNLWMTKREVTSLLVIRIKLSNVSAFYHTTTSVICVT